MKKVIFRALIISLILIFNVGLAPKAEESEADYNYGALTVSEEDDEIPPIGHRVLNYNFVDNDITMTDEELFGQYDAQTQTWVIPSKFDYDAFPKMSAVKEAAMNADGDYTLAKERFKEYYKEKKKDFNIIAPADSAADTLAAKLNSEQMYYGQGTSILNIISMNNEYAETEVDITDRVKRTQELDVKNLVVVVMGLRKDGSSAEIDSIEAGDTALIKFAI